MAAEIVTALIATSGAVVLAGATYWFTKKREREAELRKEKLEHYKEFVASVSGIITHESTQDGQRAFSRACNKLNLIAPQSVIEALQKFQHEIRVTNIRTQAGKDMTSYFLCSSWKYGKTFRSLRKTMKQVFRSEYGQPVFHRRRPWNKWGQTP